MTVRQHSLQEPRLVFGFVVVTKLDLTLVSCKLTGFVEGDRMRSIQNVITGLSAHVQTQSSDQSMAVTQQNLSFKHGEGTGEWLSYLHVEQVELHGVSGVHVLVRVEELPPQQQHLGLLHPLLPQRPAVVQPVY